MKYRFLPALLILLLVMVQTVKAKTLEIEVYGLTCAFCVDSLERAFKKMPAVSKVQVSLKTKKIRLQTEEKSPSIDVIKKVILDAGFTPINVKVVPDEADKD